MSEKSEKRADKPAPRRRPGFAVGAFVADETAATAVEFSIVALPFFALIFAIVQSAMVFFAGQTLETAVANSARLIRTGQAQQQGFDEADFRDSICDQIWGMFECRSGLKVDVETFETFDSIQLSKPVDADGDLDSSKFKYLPGAGGEIVVVRAFYQWPVIGGMLGFDLSNMPNGSHLLAATAAFRNEPFPW